MANADLRTAQAGKNDEFYTQFHDIEIEMNAYLEYNPDVFRGKTILLPCDDPEWSNFTKYFAAKFDDLGIKKLISTSYAPESKKMVLGGLFSEWEQDSPQFDADKSKTHGKIFVLERDVTGDGRINIDDLEWGRLYEEYHSKPYNKAELNKRAKVLLADEFVRNAKNIYEYLLGGEQHPELLDVRLFDDRTKRAAYARQTEKAEAEGISNCPVCASGTNNNRTKIYTLSEMDADHVTAWSLGGATSLDNCEMLCKTHNRAKGNR